MQVLTVGGAANPGSKASKKKGNKKQNKKVANAAKTTPSPETETSRQGDVIVDLQNVPGEGALNNGSQFALELEEHHDPATAHADGTADPALGSPSDIPREDVMMKGKNVEPVKIESLIRDPPPSNSKTSELVWLFFCFVGIMASFVVYGVLLEYTTSGGRKLHELSFLFVTSSLYTVTAAAGRYVRAETPTTIPPARFAILGLTSMGSTFCSVRSLRYVYRRSVE